MLTTLTSLRAAFANADKYKNDTKRGRASSAVTSKAAVLKIIAGMLKAMPKMLTEQGLEHLVYMTRGSTDPYPVPFDPEGGKRHWAFFDALQRGNAVELRLVQNLGGQGRFWGAASDLQAAWTGVEVLPQQRDGRQVLLIRPARQK